MRLPTSYRASPRRLSNDSASTRAAASRFPAFHAVRLATAAILIMLILAAGGRAAVVLGGLAISDPPAEGVVESPTIVRSLQPVRIPSTLRTIEWLLDRPVIATTLARHLYPELERYHVSQRTDGTYDVNDQNSLRGVFRLVARRGTYRVYFCEGEFRSLSWLMKLTGNMVFALDYREPEAATTEITPELYVRLNNVVAHGVLKMISPLLNGIIDRRVASLTKASLAVGERITKDPASLFREMQSWPDVRREELEEFQQAFLHPEKP